MQRLVYSLAITGGIMVYGLGVYLLVKKYRQLKKLATQDDVQSKLKSIRYAATLFTVIWSIVAIVGTFQDVVLPGLGLIYVFPISILFIGVTLIPWERYIRITPFFIYVLVIAFTFIYIHLITLLQTIYGAVID